MRERPARPGRLRILGLLATLALVAGCGSPSDDGDGGDTDVAGVVIERGTQVPPGPARTGITWSVIDGDWVGLGARTLTAAGDADRLVLDVAVGGEVGGVLREAGCELVLQATDDASLVAQGELEAELVVESPTGEVRRIDLGPAEVDVVLAPGGFYRAALSDGGVATIDAEEAAEVRCEGWFSDT